jgi:hypothetical protein
MNGDDFSANEWKFIKLLLTANGSVWAKRIADKITTEKTDPTFSEKLSKRSWREIKKETVKKEPKPYRTPPDYPPWRGNKND